MSFVDATRWLLPLQGLVLQLRTLLIDGCTVHSLFKLPVPLLDTSMYNVKPTSKLADFLRKQSLFIIDEASMVSFNTMNAIGKMLRDITGIDKIIWKQSVSL